MTWAVLVVLLMVVGLALLAIELFAIPGFGLIGILGAAGLLAAGAVAWSKLGATYGLLALAGGVGIAGFMFWLFPRTAAGRALVLADNQAGATAAGPGLAALAGKTGRAVTPLRPAGTADVEGRTVDVVTDGVYVEAGAQVRVARVEGTRVVVEVIDGAPIKEMQS